MLVLGRYPEQSLIINTSDGMIEIKVIEVTGKKVKLGIDAPKEIPVNRREVYEKIMSKNGSEI